MGNTILLNEDKPYAEMILEGEQTSETMRQLMQETFLLYDRMNTEYGQVRVLTDLSKMGAYDMGSQLTAAKGFATAAFDKMAVIGFSDKHRKLVDVMVGLAGKEDRVAFFANRDEAEAWLLQGGTDR